MTDVAARLAGAGMTPEEIELWHALSDVVARLHALPELHPMGRLEIDTAVHRVEDLVLARPAMRAQGWPRGDEDEPTVEEAHRRLLALGMTQAELELFLPFSQIGWQISQLPPLAGNEELEVVQAVHRVQDAVLARPVRRALVGD